MLNYTRLFRNSRFRFMQLGCALMILATAGCGDGRPKRVPVSGRVTIDGKPLETGFVQFVPEGDRPATGKLGPGGRFTLTTYDKEDGCVLGMHSVSVAANKSLDPTTTQWFAPKKYIRTATSGLTIEITGPRDDVEIKLTWDGGKPYIEKYQPETPDRK
jgi:hypothetical protein